MRLQDKTAAAEGVLFPRRFSIRNRLARAVWNAAWLLLFRTTPVPLHAWRRLLLRLFGARVGAGAMIYPSTRIWAPWNLVMAEHAVLGPQVDCYNCDVITVGRYAVVSQYSYLCAGTHDYNSLALPLITRPIHIGERSWVCADSFIAPGVRVGDGAVVGARSSVYRDVEPWAIVAGNPAKFLKWRQVVEGRP